MVRAQNARWEKILASPQRLDETLSKRLDIDRLVFSPLLNHLQMNALQSAQNSDSFRLLQFYQAIRNLEVSVAARRQALSAQCNSFSLSRLIGHRQPKATQLVSRIATVVERRFIRQIQTRLVQLKRQYRNLQHALRPSLWVSFVFRIQTPSPTKPRSDSETPCEFAVNNSRPLTMCSQPCGRFKPMSTAKLAFSNMDSFLSAEVHFAQ